ncbi:conserved hypothetical protein [Candidatus Methylobacter favarea]|uniref:DUF3014 domain-containing protein n=1 Tax=Candidatus Methylobacter favarea TaxID=2707345 RepID=A0A8S0XJ75_9GAMM|nr:DUF3014 domain-containing protein [Candidatus Methylobacter favarea]CAA9892963.1 conserved hypothetical protein [Candidatus Methylobacter favarea]
MKGLKTMGRYDQTRDKKPAGIIVVMATIFIILAGGGWLYFNKLKQEEAAVPETKALTIPPDSGETDADVSAPEPAPEEIPYDTEAWREGATMQEQRFVLPDLLGSDRPFREAINSVSPGLSPWLNTDQLIRKYMLIANDFSQGAWLERHMRFLKQAQPFKVELIDGVMFMSDKGYQRYDKLAAAIDAIDVRAAMSVYKKFRPLMLQVFDEFSYPAEHQLEDIFSKAAAEILAAPIIEEPIALVRPSVRYKFADKKLEALSPVSKQMIRMGPENTRIIQNKVRLLVEELASMKE